MTESPAPQASKKKSDLGPRVLTSVLMLPPLLALLIWGPHWGWAALIAAATAVGLDELYGMLMKDEAPLVRRVCVAIGTLFFVALYLFVGAKPMLELPVPQAEFVLASLSVGMWAFFLFHLMRPRKIEWVAKTIAASLSGLLYVSLSFAFLALLKRDFPETNGAWVLLLLAMTWM
ncbi:MAG: phosphatidate cytidylyltransferase, partial [Myxococcota bacterium]|nr:phosphatidate cytidylyltransferase [Myxococcota bacterium]